MPNIATTVKPRAPGAARRPSRQHSSALTGGRRSTAPWTRAGGQAISRTGTAWHELPSCVQIRCIAASASPAPAAGPRPGTRPARAQSAHRRHVRTAPARRQPRRRPPRRECTHVGGAVATAPGPSPAAAAVAHVRPGGEEKRKVHQKPVWLWAAAPREEGHGARQSLHPAKHSLTPHTDLSPEACPLRVALILHLLQRPWSTRAAGARGRRRSPRRAAFVADERAGGVCVSQVVSTLNQLPSRRSSGGTSPSNAQDNDGIFFGKTKIVFRFSRWWGFSVVREKGVEGQRWHSRQRPCCASRSQGGGPWVVPPRGGRRGRPRGGRSSSSRSASGGQSSLSRRQCGRLRWPGSRPK